MRSSRVASQRASGAEASWTCSRRMRVGTISRRRKAPPRASREGKIVAAHGDLRPEHILLRPAPSIIDCLEFSRRLRTLDVASELAYLALECERLGAPAVGARFVESCLGRLRDQPPQQLLDFYRGFHALLRAKISVWHLRDDRVEEREHWKEKARKYIALAAEYAERAQGAGS